MRIGIAIGRIGGIDGVAQETQKWITVLERLGHQIVVLTGELEAPTANTTVVPEMTFSHPACARHQEEAFFGAETREKALLDRLREETDFIEKSVLAWLRAQHIDLLITQNATTLPCHLTMGMALSRVIKSTGIAAIAHDHDFHWERGERYVSRFAGVQALVEEFFPPELPNLAHAVINTYCRDSLLARKGIEAVVIPNVMDFNMPFASRDRFNEDLPASIGYDAKDLLLFQITRIVRRKGIETAIDLVDRLDDRRVKLIITGTTLDDWKEGYYNELRALVKKRKLEGQVQFASEHFANTRSNGKGPRRYSLSDGYAHATACTYFSRYEGFGNAFVEAVAARVPIFVNNYKPVYWPEIGSKGFKTVQIEDNLLTDKAVQEIGDILKSPERCREIADWNFSLGQAHFSYEVLEELLQPLLAS